MVKDKANTKEALKDFLYEYRGHWYNLAFDDCVQWKKVTGKEPEKLREFADRLKKLIDDDK
jgi:hypothetical protein